MLAFGMRRQRAVCGFWWLARQWTHANFTAATQKFLKALLHALIAVLAGSDDLLISVLN